MPSLKHIAITSALIAVALGNNLGELPGHEEDRNIYLLASTDAEKKGKGNKGDKGGNGKEGKKS